MWVRQISDMVITQQETSAILYRFVESLSCHGDTIVNLEDNSSVCKQGLTILSFTVVFVRLSKPTENFLWVDVLNYMGAQA